jgi:hypothetical protein
VPPGLAGAGGATEFTSSITGALDGKARIALTGVVTFTAGFVAAAALELSARGGSPGSITGTGETTPLTGTPAIGCSEDG